MNGSNAMKRSEKFLIGGVVLTAVLTVIGHVLIREWYQPDLRYESGQFSREIGMSSFDKFSSV